MCCIVHEKALIFVSAKENSQKQSGRLYLFKPYPTACFWLINRPKNRAYEY